MIGFMFKDHTEYVTGPRIGPTSPTKFTGNIKLQRLEDVGQLVYLRQAVLRLLQGGKFFVLSDR